jgi:hypothetical protein
MLEQDRLAPTGTSQDDKRLAMEYVHVDAAQHLMPAEALSQSADADVGLFHACMTKHEIRWEASCELLKQSG